MSDESDARELARNMGILNWEKKNDSVLTWAEKYSYTRCLRAALVYNILRSNLKVKSLR